MEEITVKGHRRGHLVGAAVCVVVVAYNGWNWFQGNLSGGTKMLTIVPTLYLLLKIVILTRPMDIRLAGDRFLVRMGFGLDLSTESQNVADLQCPDGKIRVRFEDLNKVEASRRLMEIMKMRGPNLGTHLEFPLGSDLRSFERLRSATLKERADAG